MEMGDGRWEGRWGEGNGGAEPGEVGMSMNKWWGELC